jgi:alpha-glucosidase
MAEVGATPSWVLETHDVPRLPTRYGGGEVGLRRARAAALLLLALPGTVFLYQGQELGLEEVELADAERRDPIFFRSEGLRVGRDGCRVPLPWTTDPPAFGFSDAAPWLPQPASFGDRSVAAQERREGSTLELFRAALAARPSGAFSWVDSAPGTLVFARDGLVCAVNVDGAPLPLPEGQVVVASEPVDAVLPAGAAAWISTR